MKIERPRRGPDERGSILLQIMVMSVVVSIIAAGILRLAMFRAQMATRGALVLEEKRDDTGALAAVVSQWSTVPGPTSVCSGPPVSGGWTGCSNPGNCACVCSGPNGVVVTASLVGGSCRLSIASADRTQ